MSLASVSRGFYRSIDCTCVLVAVLLQSALGCIAFQKEKEREREREREERERDVSKARVPRTHYCEVQSVPGATVRLGINSGVVRITGFPCCPHPH